MTREIVFDGRFIKTLLVGDGDSRYGKECIERISGVSVVPLLDGGRFLLIKENVVGGGEVLRFPGGGIKGYWSSEGRWIESESPAEAAQRELVEETGYTAGKLELLSESKGTATIRHKRFSFLGRDLSFVGCRDSGEREDITCSSYFGRRCIGNGL